MTLIRLNSYSVSEFKKLCRDKKFTIGKSTKTGRFCFVCGGIMGVVADDIDYNEELNIAETKDEKTGDLFFILENAERLTGENKLIEKGKYIDVDIYGVRYSDDGKILEECIGDFVGNYIIPNIVSKIESRSFGNCVGLTSIEIPDSVTGIGSGAFYGCTGLTLIRIPDSVKEIGWNVFLGCTSLTSIIVDKNNMIYDSRDNCNAIIETASNKLICGCMFTKVPKGVTTIGSDAFRDMEGLTTIEIPDSVSNICGCAFSGCSGITSVWVDRNNKVYDSRDNCNAIIETVSNKLVFGCKCTSIPNSVIEIGSSAFRDCTSLISIEIPNSVTKIGYSAFVGCTDLKCIEIPNSVTEIGDFAFDSCKNLKSLIINCTSGNEELKINYLNHLDREIIKYVTISDGIISIPDGMFVGAKSLEMVYLSNTLAVLPDKTFNNCKSLEELNIPDSVTCIGDDCIVGCGLLKTLVIPEGVEELGNSAICDCEGLESVTLPSTIKRIGNGFLRGCPNLKQVIIQTGSKLKFLQLGLDNLKDKLVESETGAHVRNFALQGNDDELNMLFNLGRAYELGVGVGKNIVQAVMMYTKAADKGHAEAAYCIADMYRKGENLPRNMESAIKYYKIAANSNYMDSASIVKDYEESLRKVKQSSMAEQRSAKVQMSTEKPTRLKEQSLMQPYYLFFDTETTGLPARYDAPCSDTNNWPRLVQLSWIVTDINGSVISTSDNVIKPVGFSIPTKASNLHGITTTKALLEGKDLRSVVERFMSELNLVRYIVGHNIEFDINIVGAELCRLNINCDDLLCKQCICTMKSTINYCQILPYSYGSYKFPKLQELHKKLFGYEFDDAHNSKCDVEATVDCFFELKYRGIII